MPLPVHQNWAVINELRAAIRDLEATIAQSSDTHQAAREDLLAYLCAALEAAEKEG